MLNEANYIPLAFATFAPFQPVPFVVAIGTARVRIHREYDYITLVIDILMVILCSGGRG